MTNRHLASEQEALDQRLSEMVNARPERVIQTISDLVQIPSENTPPTGTELECQRYVYNRFRGLDLKTDIFELMEAPGFTDHPVYKPGREYESRPNVSAVWKGGG